MPDVTYNLIYICQPNLLNLSCLCHFYSSVLMHPFWQTTTMLSGGPQRIQVNRPEASDKNAITGESHIRINA